MPSEYWPWWRKGLPPGIRILQNYIGKCSFPLLQASIRYAADTFFKYSPLSLRICTLFFFCRKTRNAFPPEAFRWEHLLSHHHVWEASFVPTASPLCGFLLTNGLANSLMAYTTGGEPIGSLVLTGIGTDIAFKTLPGAKISHSIPEDINSQMYGLLHSLHFGPKENLAALLSYINQLGSQNSSAPMDLQRLNLSAIRWHCAGCTIPFLRNPSP